jgi:hypothetical protein
MTKCYAAPPRIVQALYKNRPSATKPALYKMQDSSPCHKALNQNGMVLEAFAPCHMAIKQSNNLKTIPDK